MLNLIAKPILDIIDKVIPDTAAKNKAKAELQRLESNGELQIMLKQIELNMIEAKSESKFKSGWRPAIGWCCVLIFAFNYIVMPFLHILGIQTPTLDISGIMPVLLGMLGLGGLRTFEKKFGVSK